MNTITRIPATIDERAEQDQIPSTSPPNPQTIPGPTTGGAAGSVQAPPPSQPNPAPSERAAPGSHALKSTFFGEIAGTDGPLIYESLRRRVTKAYRAHTYQYWFVATTSNGALFLQILIAACLTALGAINDHRTRPAIVVLGATNTVIAGLLTYFKSRNQPNRSRQFRNDLAGVVEQLDDAEANFRNPFWQGNEFVEVEKIRAAYKQARIDAQANYPDLWVRGTSPYNPNFTPKISTDPEDGTSGLRPEPNFARSQAWSPSGLSVSRRTSERPSRPISGSTLGAEA